MRIDRAYIVAAAAGRDLNDELTVMLSSLDQIANELEKGHPALPLLAEMQSAVQRCAWTASGLLEFSARRGVPPVGVSLERLLAM